MTYIFFFPFSTRCLEWQKNFLKKIRWKCLWKTWAWNQTNFIWEKSVLLGNYFATIMSICCIYTLHGCRLSVWRESLMAIAQEFCKLYSNKSWRQHPTKQLLYGHISPMLKTIQVRHAGHCWRSKSQLISDVLLWTPSHWQARVRWPVRTYLQQFCTDTGCSMEDLPRVMDDRDEW